MEPRAVPPVKVVLEFAAPAQGAGATEGWIRELLDSATRTGALEGSSVVSTDGGRYLVLLRFASREDHDRWCGSAEAEQLLRRGKSFAVRERPVERTGLETWFALPGGRAPLVPPPRWKMAVVTWCGVFPLALGLSYAVPRTLPRTAGVAVTTTVLVTLLTWVVMPRLTGLLRGWLYGGGEAR